MKKLILLFLIAFFVSFAGFVSAEGNICCEKECSPATADVGDEVYTLKCCADTGTAYLGCLGFDSTAGILQSYCLNDMIGACMQCKGTPGNYYWDDVSDSSSPVRCSTCKKQCEVENDPITGNLQDSTCVFEGDYKCILGADTCLVEGQVEQHTWLGYFCCGLKSDNTYEAAPGNADSDFFSDSNNNNIYDNGDIYHATEQPGDLPLIDICDTETSEADCDDDVDNDGDGYCDFDGCTGMPQRDPDCDTCPDLEVGQAALSEDGTTLCTNDRQITCTESKTCDVENLGSGSEYFCSGNEWIHIHSCESQEGCFTSDGVKYYWVGDRNKVCKLMDADNAIIGETIATDSSSVICELLEEGTQGECNVREETGCWDEDATGPNSRCCGDDGSADSWISDNQACFEGKFYMDPDDLPGLCEVVSGYQGTCATHDTVGCWFDNKCCGDDAYESWIHSTSTLLDDILVPSSCYNGKWFDRINAKVTYYELFIVP